MSSSSPKLYVALGAGALLGLCSGAYADNWELLPRIETGGMYNDNYRLSNVPADELQVYGPYIDWQLAADLVSPKSKLEIIPRIHSTFFPPDHADQSTDGFLDVDGEYHTLRSVFTGIAEYSNQTVINTELLPATFPGVELGQVVGGEYGTVSIRSREQQERVAPNFTYDFTQRTHLNLQGEYDRATFTNTGQFQQIGYDNYTGQAGLLFNVSERSTLSVNGVGSRFQPQSGGHDTDTYGANIEWDLLQTQVMHFYARIGDNRTQANTTVGTVSANGVTGGVGVEWRYQITEVVLDVLRGLSPSDAGSEVVNNEARFRVLRAFSPRLSGYLAGTFVQVRGASDQALLAIASENYYTAEVGSDYQITQNYRVEVKYDLMWQRFEGQASAHSNAVAVSFIYQPLSQYEPLPELTGIPQEER